MKNDLIGFTVTLTCIVIACFLAFAVIKTYQLSWFLQALVFIAFTGLASYLPAWIWAKITNR